MKRLNAGGEATLYEHAVNIREGKVGHSEESISVRKYLLVEFSTLRDSMLNGFKLFEVK